jgi:hypothetical protein
MVGKWLDGKSDGMTLAICADGNEDNAPLTSALSRINLEFNYFLPTLMPNN